LHEDKAGCYEAEAEAENFRLEANRLNYGTELKAVKAVKAIPASISQTTVETRRLMSTLPCTTWNVLYFVCL